MKKLKKITIICFVTLIFSYVFGYLLNMFVSNGFVFRLELSTDYLLAKKTLLYCFEFFAIITLIFVFSWFKHFEKNPKKLMQSGNDDREIYTGLEIRSLLGLRSTDFTIEKNENEVKITTKGYGHGVGLSQYGANGYAKNGLNYQKILLHYYPGVSLKHL